MRFLPILLALCLPVGCGIVPQASVAQESGVFDYDRARPLDARIEPLNSSPIGQSFKLSFEGNRERVTGVLTVPRGAVRAPSSLFSMASAETRARPT